MINLLTLLLLAIAAIIVCIRYYKGRDTGVSCDNEVMKLLTLDADGLNDAAAVEVALEKGEKVTLEVVA